MTTRLAALLAALAAATSASAAGPTFSPQAVEFFENKVRPVLAEHCQSCHGPKKEMGGLRLDSRDAVLKGGDTGPAAVAGDPAKSLLVKAVNHDGDLKMPEKGKLPADAIASLTEWVRLGLPWPAGETPKATATIEEVRNRHWAFRPVTEPVPPAVKNAAWPLNPIDRFILAGLEARGIAPSPEPDRRTLLRRASVDLTGLPPTSEEVEAFEKDASPDAWEKAVDRLLASPHHGERWARHWLDVARYADNKGYVFQEDRNYPFAYAYRDWVVEALNRDLPYDRFLKEQLAADLLPAEGDNRHLVALGFLTVGRRFLNSQPDIIDDRIDVVFRGTQGLTVTCARCHDHKYDPLPTKDYYSLYGVFASCSEPREGLFLTDPGSSPAFQAYEKELHRRQAELDTYRQKTRDAAVARLRKPESMAAYLLAVRDLAVKPPEQARSLIKERDLNRVAVERWRSLLERSAKPDHPVFGPWHALAALPDADFAARAPAILATLPKADPKVAVALVGKKPATLAEVAGWYGTLLAATPELLGPDAPPEVPLAQVDGLFNVAERNENRRLQTRVDQQRGAAGAPPRAMVLNDLPNPVQPRVFVRGNPGNPGEVVPRQFPAVLAGAARKPFTKGSGRLEMAEAIASRDNPLTARVMVNRVWAWHFGQGLVRTPSDFGIRSDPPTHPELLDWLAARFVADGWSLKKLHKLILTSRTWRQASDARPELAKTDPENRLLARQNRRRLDFESLRDGLLAASGELDTAVGGPPVQIFTPTFSKRRTLYGYVDRQNLPGTLRTFDFAGPDQHAPQRFQTTVPQQALFLMNSPFVAAQARALAALPEVAEASDPANRVRALYRRVYAREATAEEVTLGVEFVKAGPAGETTAADGPDWQYGYGAFDESAGKLKSFTPLPHVTSVTRQGGPTLPDPKLGWAMLNEAGGHPGGPGVAVVRRWTAPADGVVIIAGTLHHPSKDGDGVRARVVSSRSGVLGAWKAHNSRIETAIARVEVKAGDRLDLVVDCLANEGFDSFVWTATLRQGGREWATTSGFTGPQARPAALDAWGQYAQVLLLANEFAFVD